MRRKTVERNVLFLCEDNSCLSQMAEAMAKYLNPPNAHVHSAGLNPRAILSQVYDVMAEFGIGLSQQTSKGLNAVPLDAIDLVISFGGVAKRCDRLPAKARIEFWCVPDPHTWPVDGSEPLANFRHCRDAIDMHVAALFLDHWRNVA